MPVDAPVRLTSTSGRIDRALAGLDSAQETETRSTLRRLQEDCGCREGAILMISATAAAAFLLAQDTASRSATSITAIVVGVMFFSALVGKALGLLIARARLVALLRELERPP